MHGCEGKQVGDGLHSAFKSLNRVLHNCFMCLPSRTYVCTLFLIIRIYTDNLTSVLPPVHQPDMDARLLNQC